MHYNINMKITIVYDNETLVPGCRASHGFAAYLEYYNKHILFDTGWNGKILLENLNRFQIDPAKLDIIFLSHQHWDHIGGLSILLEFVDKPLIVIPKSFTPHFEKELLKYGKLLEVEEPSEVIAGLYTSGELETDIGIKEQSLGISTGDGKIIILTGCSHPQVPVIYKALMKFGPVKAIIGGFHGFKELDFFRKFDLVIPCHCTVIKQEILRDKHIQSEKCGVGLTVSF